MSLVRLLSAGKSLVGGQSGPGRYRMNKQMRLPKFISTRNPFTSEAANGAAFTQPETPRREHPQQTSTARRAGPRESRLTALALRLSLATRRSVAWLGKANPFSNFRESAGPKKSVMSGFTKPPVQSELCLEKVQVVRNDLSDADLEVVAVELRPITPELVGKQCETTGRTWGRLTTRIFG